MKILVISLPAWSDKNNGGNTLSNLFSGFDAEFANIYFREGQPENAICHRYYQVTDHDILLHLLKGKKLGRSFTNGDCSSDAVSFEKQAKKHAGYFLQLMRELAWKICRVETSEMDHFIAEFQPDLIYAPTYGNLHMLRIVRDLKQKIGKPLVTLISDDLYGTKNWYWNPFHQLYQILLRNSLHQSFIRYDLIYTMTEEQKEEYEKIFGRKMQVLRKSRVTAYQKRQPAIPIHVIYAGGSYNGREEILKITAKAVHQLNSQGVRFVLDIYSEVSSASKAVLNNQVDTFVYAPVSYTELIWIYQKSDIALIVESFAEADRRNCRLSFSTKIVDCLQSGLPILAVGPSENAGFRYLQSNQAAVCISNPMQIGTGLQRIAREYSIWQSQAYQCLIRNHDPLQNQRRLQSDFQKLVNRSQG